MSGLPDLRAVFATTERGRAPRSRPVRTAIVSPIQEATIPPVPVTNAEADAQKKPGAFVPGPRLTRGRVRQSSSRSSLRMSLKAAHDLALKQLPFGGGLLPERGSGVAWLVGDPLVAEWHLVADEAANALPSPFLLEAGCVMRLADHRGLIAVVWCGRRRPLCHWAGVGH